MLLFSQRQLQEQIEQMGILPSDTLLIHSSMKAIGEVEGGADTVLDAFIDYLHKRSFGAAYPHLEADQ